MASPNLEILVPTIATEAQYAITGTDCQILSINLKPGARLESESGAMVFMSPDVRTTAECGSCTRSCAGETCCKVIYTNQGAKDAYVGLSSDFPAKIVPVDLGSWGDSNLISKAGAYLSNVGDVEVTVNCDCGVTGCCIRGMGCIRQSSKGSGTVFLEAGGTVLTRTLGAGEKIVVDSDSVVGFQDTVQLGYQMNGGPCTWCFGGEGCCNLTMSGPGNIMIQSMSREKFMGVMAPGPMAGTSGAADTSANA